MMLYDGLIRDKIRYHTMMREMFYDKRHPPAAYNDTITLFYY